MKKLLIFALVFLAAFGIALAYSQTSTQLLSSSNFATALGDGTFTNSGGCSPSGYAVVTQSVFTACASNNGACFSGYSAQRLPTFGTLTACATTTSGPTPTPAPSPTATATPIHTSGLSVTDGCITNTNNWPDAGGTVSESFQSNNVVTGSTCVSSGNQLNNGSARQLLNGGSSINAGTTIVVGANLYGGTSTVTAGATGNGCTQGSATANGSATVELIDSVGNVAASSTVSGNSAWTSRTASFTLSSAGIYYIEIISQMQTVIANGSVYVVNPHTMVGACQSTSAMKSASGYVTGMSVSSS